MELTWKRLAVTALLAPVLSLAEPPAEVAAGAPAPEVLQGLKAGHERFMGGRPAHLHQDAKRLAETAAGQTPGAVILGCADSRVPPEILFDEGLGDLFVVRVAGNVAGPAVLGSIEYATEHLGVPLVIVLGHHRCGAVTAAIESRGEPKGNIGAILREIAPAIVAAKARPAGEGLVDDAVHANVDLVARRLLRRSPVIADQVRTGKVMVTPAVYDLATGKIEWGEPIGATAKRN